MSNAGQPSVPGVQMGADAAGIRTGGGSVAITVMVSSVDPASLTRKVV
jgi:hypothetical protein